MESIDIERAVAEVRVAADQSGALILEAIISVGERGIPEVALAAAEFPRFIRHLKPKIVYLFVNTFDAGEELEKSLDDEDLLENPHAKKLITSWHFRDGQTCQAVLGVMYDNILYGIVEETDWFEKFETEAEALSDELQQLAEEDEKKQKAKGYERIIPKVRQLMSDPRFNAPKVGIAKRTALAESLFPDLDRDTINAIVERAEKEHWLATATK